MQVPTYGPQGAPTGGVLYWAVVTGFFEVSVAAVGR